MTAEGGGGGGRHSRRSSDISQIRSGHSPHFFRLTCSKLLIYWHYSGQTLWYLAVTLHLFGFGRKGGWKGVKVIEGPKKTFNERDWNLTLERQEENNKFPRWWVIYLPCCSLGRGVRNSTLRLGQGQAGGYALACPCPGKWKISFIKVDRKIRLLTIPVLKQHHLSKVCLSDVRHFGRKQ